MMIDVDEPALSLTTKFDEDDIPAPLAAFPRLAYAICTVAATSPPYVSRSFLFCAVSLLDFVFPPPISSVVKFSAPLPVGRSAIIYPIVIFRRPYTVVTHRLSFV